MANTKISDLSAGAAVSATDVLPNVQTTGVGPVKTTAAELKTFMSASPTLVTPNIGTPSAGTLTNCTGLPVSTGVSGLGTGVATFLATPSSANLASAVTDETGSGALVFANTPTLVTPVLGVATATSVNKVALTAPATSATLTIADGKTLTASNTLTLTGTDSSSVAFGAGGTVAYVANKLSVFAATTSAELAGVISDETGSGALVFANSPTFTDDITLGAQQTTRGSIILCNTAAGAYQTTIQPSNSASAAWTLTLPTTAGTSGYVLQTDGTGVTSWAAGGSGSPGGSTGEIQYNNGGAFDGVGSGDVGKWTGMLCPTQVTNPGTWAGIYGVAAVECVAIKTYANEIFAANGQTEVISTNSGGGFSWTSGSTASSTIYNTRLTSPAAGVVRVSGSTTSVGGCLQYVAYAYADRPGSPAAGMVIYISDASNATPAFGDTVSAGGGSTKVLCWYNGSNWTVIGK